ncbi:MAG: DUF1549 and DUF1553 domain-containing protein [Gemmataceae bacterium]|nr:DUF1549 and DUF1553 domain-containing protein [Gemmataceae bacterium]
MNRATRRAAEREPRARRHYLRWACLLTVGVVSLGVILFSKTPGDEAYAQAPKGKAKAKAAPPQRVPGAGTTLDAAALTRIINEEVARRLKEEDIKVSPLTDDAQFLRRVYLDLVGVIPPAEKVTAFLESKDPAKRGKVVEELLADSRYGKWLAENWVTAMIPPDSMNRALRRGPLQDWLTEHFNANKPWDKIVYDLLTATGEQQKNGAVTYFIGNASVDKMTDSVTKLFMGVQLQCAQCHNHPFTNYKQDEYWAMAQFFMKVRLSANPQQAAKKGISPGITEIANVKGKAKKGFLPESAKFLPAQFLQGDRPKMNSSDPARPVLAKWMTTPDNPFFARALVNKVWGQFFGRGLVNPVDDMHEGNPATHPELLAALTEQFKRNNFDMKYLIRAIVNSEPYQRTSRSVGGNETDTELLSHAAIRALTPEQLYDSLTRVVGTPAGGKGRFGKKAPVGKKGPVGPREQFIAFFRVEEGADVLDYQAGIPQALRLMNSALLNNSAPVVNQAIQAANNDQGKIVEHLYLAILSRRPTAEELQARLTYIRRQSDARTAYGDLTWALLNCSEFALNH